MDEKSYILKTKSTTIILTYLGIVMALVPIIYMTIARMTGETSLTQVILNVLCYVGLSIFYIILLRNYLFDDLKEFKKRLLICILVIIGTIVVIKLSDALFTWIYNSLNQDMGKNQNSVIDMVNNYPIFMFLSSAIFAPFVEEIVFRKAIFSFFKNDWLALLTSTLAFALIHVIASLDFIHIFPYLAAGFIFSLAYILSKRNIWVTIIAHSLINLISFIVLVL